MNPTIVKIIDMMFRGVPENQETAAMREELLTNSQARFEDLVSSGVSADDALGQVLDHLRGVEELLDDYRTGKRTASAAPTLNGEDSFAFARFERMAEEIDQRMERIGDKVENTAKSAYNSAISGFRSAMDSLSGIFSGSEGAASMGESGMYRSTPTNVCWQPVRGDEELLEAAFSPSEYRRLSVQLVGEDIQVEASPDGMIHVEISKVDEPLYLLEAAGGCITLHHNPAPDLPAGDGDTGSEELEGLSGILGGIGRVIRNAFRSARTSGDSVRLLLPDGLEQITLQTASGDIDMEGLNQPAITASTVSGDVDMTDCRFTGMVRLGSASGDVEVDHSSFIGGIALNTTSGDLSFSGIASSVNANNVSGDTDIQGSFSQLRANAVSGDIDVTAEEELQILHANTTSGDIDISLPSGLQPAVSANTTSGDVSLELATNPASAVQVKLNSVSGDINVCNF